MELLLLALYNHPSPQALITKFINCHTRQQRFAKRYAEEIVWIASKRGVDPYLIAAIVQVESRFKRNAVSPTHDYGAMQVNGRTLRYLGYFPDELTDSFYIGIDAGAQVIKSLQMNNAKKDLKWICKYNIGNQKSEATKRICDRYFKKVMYAYEQITNIVREPASECEGK